MLVFECHCLYCPSDIYCYVCSVFYQLLYIMRRTETETETDGPGGGHDIPNNLLGLFMKPLSDQ